MKPKNILLLMTDQHRWDHIGYHPEHKLKTPNLDRLAESVGFTDCVSVSPLCTPARCALLTGRYAHQVNMRTMSGELSPSYPTFPRALQKQGYRTAMIGKTHWWQGWDWFDSRPEAHYDLRNLREELKAYGFEHVWECTDKRALGINQNDFTTYLRDKGYAEQYIEYYQGISGATFKIEDHVREQVGAFPFPEEDHGEHVVTNKIIEEIDAASRGERPFFVFGSYFAPHEPIDPPQRFLDQVPYEEIDDFAVLPGQAPLTLEMKRHLWKLRQGYKALVLMLDEQARRILEALEARDLLKDTVIVFTADHGDQMGDHGFTQKGCPYKQSVNVPAAIRHPDYLSRRVNHYPVELTDLTATLLDVAGLDPQAALAEDWPSYRSNIPARSLMPVVRGEAERVREFAFSESDMKWHDAALHSTYCWQMIEDSEWKYVRYIDRSATTPGTQRKEVLIDRKRDPNEVHDRHNDTALATVLETARARLDFINDTTPTAQTDWIPFEKRQPCSTGSGQARG